ncbi:DUF6320 domain-containing protein [Clostridium senegalense]|uniref:DUF6320 domain-containing protein n=1 Tax=Clostridium senegalense TaxID=1465809 RepID=UPI001C10D69C|nr:DUF6320 domain-containing protein [Clostridium senegalense]MBU5227333.1 hypothetical protein [Clostridium senegalense]
MPYCPKCGIEVEYTLTECPLCEFSLPNTTPDSFIKEENKFPDATNIYPSKHEQLKKVIFSVLLAISICGIFIATLQNIYFSKTITWSRYSTVSILSGIIYLYIILKTNLSLDKFIKSMATNTLFLIILLDIVDGELYWSITFGLPCIFLATIFILSLVKLIRISKNPGFNIAAYVIFLLTLYSLAIDTLICLNYKESIILTWSIIISFIGFPLSIALLYIHHKLPEQYKEKFRKKFHI